MNLNDFREKLDEIDSAIVEKLQERFRIAKEIGKYKKENNLKIEDREREAIKLDEIENVSEPEFASYNMDVFEAIIEASKELQEEVE